jgi:hypothetical protein
MSSTPLRPDKLQYLLETLDKDYKALIAAHRQQYREETKAEARQALTESVSKARQTVEHFRGTQDPELRGLLAKLTIQSELAGHTLVHPETVWP